MPVKAADPEIDRVLQSTVGKHWVTNGGNLTNQRYSTLKQMPRKNTCRRTRALEAAHPGTFELLDVGRVAAPLVKDGIMYIVTGNDDVFALNAKTGSSCGNGGRVSTRS
jgi:quinohemoprotein ethanol dehydrogenase